MGHGNFTIRIGPRRDQKYTIYISSPAGEHRSQLDLSLIQVLLSELVAACVDPRGVMTAETLRHFGGTLFRALFQGRTLSLLDRSLGMTEKQGLRIIVQTDSMAPQINSLPWEFLYREETRQFLGRSRWSPVIRRLEAQQPLQDQPPPPTLRILIIASSPPGVPPLDTEAEVRNIREAWQSHDNVEIHVLENARIDSLRQTMSAHAFHILHFAGHGDFLQGRGVLLFGSDDLGTDPVAGEFLADHLTDFKSLRLVLFNACDTARIFDQKEYDPFAGVATAMVLGGVPAVVAMQFPISDQAALAFSNTFYRQLAAGASIEVAVVEGRLAIRAQDRDSVEWGTPVVFLRDQVSLRTESRLLRSPSKEIGWPWNRGRGPQPPNL